jgi:hypothetical protein
MSCENVQKRISLLMDRRLPSGERENVLAHLETCRTCATEFASMQDLRATMREMAMPPVPAELTARLRVAASYHRASIARRRDSRARLQHLGMRIRLAFDNMMRPVAVPLAGGLFSSFACFFFLLPSLSFQHNYGLEPPIFHTDPAIVAGFTDPDGEIVGVKNAKLEWGSSLVSGDEVSLTLLVDPSGQVQDWNVYSCDHGQCAASELTPEMKDMILFSKFIPATMSGQPAWGLKQVVFPRIRRMRS